MEEAVMIVRHKFKGISQEEQDVLSATFGLLLTTGLRLAAVLRLAWGQLYDSTKGVYAHLVHSYYGKGALCDPRNPHGNAADAERIHRIEEWADQHRGAVAPKETIVLTHRPEFTSEHDLYLVQMFRRIQEHGSSRIDWVAVQDTVPLFRGFRSESIRKHVERLELDALTEAQLDDRVQTLTACAFLSSRSRRLVDAVPVPDSSNGLKAPTTPRAAVINLGDSDDPPDKEGFTQVSKNCWSDNAIASALSARESPREKALRVQEASAAAVYGGAEESLRHSLVAGTTKFSRATRNSVRVPFTMLECYTITQFVATHGWTYGMWTKLLKSHR